MNKYVLLSGFRTFNCNLIICGITVGKTKVKVFDVQFQEGKDELKQAK